MMHQHYIEQLVDQILAITNPPRPEGTRPFNKGGIKEGDYLNNPTKQAKACLSEDARRQVKQYEHQIDQLVYKLYNLTDEEIKIVEGHK